MVIGAAEGRRLLIAWDPETGEFDQVEGPKGFATWAEAEEAGRFLKQLEGPGK